MEIVIKPSSRKFKKYEAHYNGKVVHFGDDRYEDFTMHKNEERKKAYLNRHKRREDWNDPKTAGYWSRWLLWNKPTLKESADDIKKRSGLVVRLELNEPVLITPKEKLDLLFGRENFW